MAKDLEAPKPFVPSVFSDGAKLDAGNVEEMRFGLAGSGPLAKAVLDSNAVAARVQLGLGVGQIVPAGMLSPYAGSAAPTGWLLCDGSAVSRVAYSVLFTVVGTTYGVGDGSTTFNVPDLRGRVVAGKDYDVGGLSNRLTTAGSNINGTAINASGGDQLLQQHLHSVTDPGHFHSVTDPGHAHNYYYNRSLAGYGLPYPNYGNAVYTNDYGKAMSYEATGVSIQSKVTGISIQNQGGGTTSSQNVQPTIILNYIIRT